MSFHSTLASKAGGAIVKACVVGSCRLDLEGAGKPLTALDCDREPLRSQFPGKRCDFLVFLQQNPLTVVAVEMEAPNWRPSEVRKQLQAGAAMADQLADSWKVDRFLPLLLAESVDSPQQLKALGNQRVSFRGRKYWIVQKRCGTALRTLLPCPSLP